jgi:hypothetical protein
MKKKVRKLIWAVVCLTGGITASVRSYKILLKEDDPNIMLGVVSLILGIVILSGAFLFFKEAMAIDSKPRNDVGNQLRDLDNENE